MVAFVGGASSAPTIAPKSATSSTPRPAGNLLPTTLAAAAVTLPVPAGNRRPTIRVDWISSSPADLAARWIVNLNLLAIYPILVELRLAPTCLGPHR